VPLLTDVHGLGGRSHWQRYYRRRRATAEVQHRLLGCMPLNQVPRYLRPVGPGVRNVLRPRAKHRRTYPAQPRTRPYTASEIRPPPPEASPEVRRLADVDRAEHLARRPARPPPPAPVLGLNRHGQPQRIASAGTRPACLAYGSARWAVSRPGTTSSPSRRFRHVANGTPRAVVLPTAEPMTSSVCAIPSALWVGAPCARAHPMCTGLCPVCAGGPSGRQARHGARPRARVGAAVLRPVRHRL
jgi:hypothetical protein